MKIRWLIALLCFATWVQADDDLYADQDRRLRRYLRSLSDTDLGKKLKGVQLKDGSMALAGHTLLHRIQLTSKQAHVYVVRDGSLTMGMPTAYVWVELKGKQLTKPRIPAGEPREAAYAMGEVFTSSNIGPEDGLIEISCPTEQWIKSLQAPAAAKWGVEAMATINDPDGYTNVRDDDGKIVATVKTGERFLAIKPFQNAKQWEVYLASGVVGLMDESRIRLIPQEPPMKLNFELSKAEWKAALANLETAATKAGEDSPAHPEAYFPTLLQASGGDLAALSRFFARKFDNAPANAYVRDAWKLLHLADDARFAEMLTRQQQEFRDLAEMLSQEWTTAPISDGKQYLKQHFPRSYQLLFGR